MANGVLGMTPKLGKRKTEMMTAALLCWRESMRKKCQKCYPNTYSLFAKHELAHFFLDCPTSS